MKKIMSFMTNKFTPVVNKITKNPWVSSIQDSFMAIVPVILVASIITILSLVKEWIPAAPDFSYINKFTFGLLGFFIAFLMPYYVMEKHGHHNKKLVAGMTGLALYLMLLSPAFEGDNVTFIFSRFSAVGMFLALFVGFFTGIVMRFFSKRTIFSEDSVMPDFVISWFESLLPVTIIMFGGWIISYKLQLDFFLIILKIFSPLSKIIQTYPGFVLSVFAPVFLYTFGISGWAVMPVIYPVYMAGLAQNQHVAEIAQAAGQTVTIDQLTVATQETCYAFSSMGGIGTTLPLAFMLLLFSKSSRLKAIGKATIVPSVFNINEPLMFGSPVVFNPFLMIPMWISAIIIPSIAYFVMKAGLVSIPTKAFSLWYVPYPLTSYFATQDLRAVIFAFIVFAVAFAIYFPFFKAYDNQQLKIEAEVRKNAEPVKTA